jgi:hypothetical protein
VQEMAFCFRLLKGGSGKNSLALSFFTAPIHLKCSKRFESYRKLVDHEKKIFQQALEHKFGEQKDKMSRPLLKQCNVYRKQLKAIFMRQPKRE